MKFCTGVFSFLIFICLVSCRQKALFTLIPADHTGIHFDNHITEKDSVNPIDLTNIYNGGGVGVGDFNNDGLQDNYTLIKGILNFRMLPI